MEKTAQESLLEKIELLNEDQAKFCLKAMIVTRQISDVLVEKSIELAQSVSFS